MSILAQGSAAYNGKSEEEHYRSLGFEGVPTPIDVEISWKLDDRNRSGKEKPWRAHKSSSLLLSESFDRIGKQNKADAVKYCGTALRFQSCPHGHEKRLKWASFCRVRLCPMCGWRRSLKVATQVKRIAHVANSQFKIRWLFLTLTCKNVKSDDLKEALDLLTASFHRLIKRKRFTSDVMGFFRALEVTRNEETGEYHPHLHVLLAVRPSYFTRGYIKQSEWASLWQDALRADYTPIVDVRAVKGKRDKSMEEQLLRDKGIVLENGNFEEISSDDDYLDEAAVAEISKYTVKSKDYIIKGNEYLTDEIVSTYEANLNHRRLFAFGGVLKDIYEYLKAQGDVEDVESDRADLVAAEDHEGCTCSVCQSNFVEELYRWIPGRNNYHIIK